MERNNSALKKVDDKQIKARSLKKSHTDKIVFLKLKDMKRNNTRREI